MPADELFKHETQTLRRSLLQTDSQKQQNIWQKIWHKKTMNTESKHKDVMELRTAGMLHRKEELKEKQICLAS